MAGKDHLTSFTDSASTVVLSGITQKNGLEFALVEASAVQVAEDGTRLDDKLSTIETTLEGVSTAPLSEGTGSNSVQLKGSTASGDNAVALGENTTAEADNALTVGVDTLVMSNGGVATGYKTVAGGKCFILRSAKKESTGCSVVAEWVTDDEFTFLSNNISLGLYASLRINYNFDGYKITKVEKVTTGKIADGDVRITLAEELRVVSGLDWYTESNFPDRATTDKTKCVSIGTNTAENKVKTATLWIIGHPEIGTFNIDELVDTTNNTVSADARGYNTKAQNIGSHAEGRNTKAEGKYSHTEGDDTTAGYGSHAEGKLTKALGNTTHAEGHQTECSPQSAGAHAEGWQTKVTSLAGHAEGLGASAEADAAHAEGCRTNAKGYAAHSEGYHTSSSGAQSHAEGNGTKAVGESSHAEGNGTQANGKYSHAGGYRTKANNDGETAVGKYNKSSADTLYSVGNGTSDTNRKNAFEIKKNGDAYVQSDIYIGGDAYISGSIHGDDIADLQDKIDKLQTNIDTVSSVANAANYDASAAASQSNYAADTAQAAQTAAQSAQEIASEARQKVDLMGATVQSQISDLESDMMMREYTDLYQQGQITQIEKRVTNLEGFHSSAIENSVYYGVSHVAIPENSFPYIRLNKMGGITTVKVTETTVDEVPHWTYSEVNSDVSTIISRGYNQGGVLTKSTTITCKNSVGDTLDFDFDLNEDGTVTVSLHDKTYQGSDTNNVWSGSISATTAKNNYKQGRVDRIAMKLSGNTYVASDINDDLRCISPINSNSSELAVTNCSYRIYGGASGTNYVADVSPNGILAGKAYQPNDPNKFINWKLTECYFSIKVPKRTTTTASIATSTWYLGVFRSSKALTKDNFKKYEGFNEISLPHTVDKGISYTVSNWLRFDDDGVAYYTDNYHKYTLNSAKYRGLSIARGYFTDSLVKYSVSERGAFEQLNGTRYFDSDIHTYQNLATYTDTESIVEDTDPVQGDYYAHVPDILDSKVPSILARMTGAFIATPAQYPSENPTNPSYNFFSPYIKVYAGGELAFVKDSQELSAIIVDYSTQTTTITQKNSSRLTDILLESSDSVLLEKSDN